MACGGQCVDTQTSASNCGGCGASCTGGTCTKGVCKLVVTADGGPAPSVGDFPCIAVDSQNVYVATGMFAGAGGLIYRVPISGGAPQIILPTENRPHGIASDGTNLFWADYAAGTIRKSGLDGSNPTTIVPGQTSPYALALDMTHVYWNNWGDGTVWQANKDGSNPVQLGMGLTVQALGYIATSGTNVFFTDRTAGVVYDAKVGMMGTSFASMQGGPTGVAVDSTDLFWSNATAGTIVAEPLNKSAAAKPIVMGQTRPNAVVTDGTSVYWSDQGTAGVANSGSINKVATSGGMVTPLASGQNIPTCIAIDATSIYWINVFGGVIGKTGR
jgi:hypothetical protein